MNRYNLLEVTEVRCPKSSPLWTPVTTLFLPRDVVEIPKPVMIGLGIFILHADKHIAKQKSVKYGGYEFYINDDFNKNDHPQLEGLWKYLLDAGLEPMSKVCSHDYTKMEHFVRRKNERLPVEIDGFQTKLVVEPGATDVLKSAMWIRQTLVRDDLMAAAENNPAGDVVNLNAPKSDNWIMQTETVPGKRFMN
ncbi:TPA: hypothetical protein ACTPQ1_004684 [Salmonella enterica]